VYFFSSDSTISGHRKSFHIERKVNAARVTRIGDSTGATIVRKIFHSPAPSSRAASSRSAGAGSSARRFLVRTLFAVWLAEVLAGIMVNPIQSLLLCTALCVFYLLELSLAEHVGFVPAYLAAASAITLMIGAYGSVALRSFARGVGLGAGIAVLYGFLYVVLVAEDYALLLGSIGLFVLLAAVMIATRRVDWERLEARPAAAA